jgi:hypothetical protein
LVVRDQVVVRALEELMQGGSFGVLRRKVLACQLVEKAL